MNALLSKKKKLLNNDTQTNSISIKNTQIIWWLLSCHIFLCQCNNKKEASDNALQKSTYNATQLNNLIKQVKHADIITRTGNDFTSRTLRKMQQYDQTYSHCGIVAIEKDTVFVYHALGGEFNPKQTILKQPIAQFCNWQENFGIGLFRFNVSDANRGKIVNEAVAFFDKEIPFDLNFSLQSTDSLYCAEYVQKAVNQATSLNFDTSYIKRFAFFGVDNITKQQKCVPIFAIKYKL
jgi:uncharacterized protein YnzC (UPF0291/DUF896 family)